MRTPLTAITLLALAWLQACAAPPSTALAPSPAEPPAGYAPPLRAPGGPPGTRVAPASTSVAATAQDFSGLWETRYGRMRLVADGPRIRGTYAYAGQSHLQGEVTEGELRFTYEQPDGEAGEGVFRLGADGDSFDGSWTARGGRGGPWRGTRVVPEAGRRWLVVLEANWEGGLHEPEYSYGEMLRSFFTRAPSVSVRHRFVSDLADLRRWCAEVVYLAEPVVLYLSSHGTEAGIALGAEDAGADDLIAALADVPDLELLHFGSCSVMGGEVPARITDARAEGARFPISGFTRPADWAGSALVDFTYLELVLLRGFSPSRALEATREMVSFAREDSAGPIAGSGLALHAPRAAGGE